LWLSFDKYDGSTRLSTWIYRIALNVAISAYRKQARRREVREPVPETAIGADPETDELLDRLKAYIEELRELDRALLILSLDGNSHTEIADILGITPTNVSTRLSRVRQQLRQKFNP
ncbi:MAG: RNA polymerase sigma factor, partial [Siphonobacter aquaeclarae]|nr:RNA polymerase sigma factor [Siphonobacter aquaeclarae]